MLKIVALLGLIALAAAGPLSTKNAKNVEGVIFCPSEGAVIAVRVPRCTRVPCEVFVAETLKIQFDFIPKYAHAAVRLVVKADWGGVEFPLLNEILSGQINPGNMYTFEYDITVSSQFVNNEIVLVNELSGVIAPEPMEVCARAAVKVSPAP